MKTLIFCLTLVGLSALGGCGEMVTRPDGTKMPATVFAHIESVEAVKAIAAESATCDNAVASSAPPKPLTEMGQAIEALRTIGALAVCGQRVAGKGGVQVPQYIAPPTMLDRVVQLAPVMLGVGQLVASDRANARQTQASVDIAGIGANRELGIVQAATGSNERIATGGFNAVGNVAGVGFAALGNAATSANYASAANVQALAGTIANAKPTTQIIAGRDVIQARDVDQSATGGDRVTGDGNRLRNTVECTALGGNGAPATAGNNSGAGGATSPLTAGYNPLVSGGDGAAGSNNCGGG